MLTWFIFPGKGENPVSQFTSPLACPVALSKGSNWLYSTLITIFVPKDHLFNIDVNEGNKTGNLIKNKYLKI